MSNPKKRQINCASILSGPLKAHLIAIHFVAASSPFMSSFKQQSVTCPNSSPSPSLHQCPVWQAWIQILQGWGWLEQSEHTVCAQAPCTSHRDTGKDHNLKLNSSAAFKTLNTGKSGVSVQWKDTGTKINISKGLWTLKGF